MDADDLLSSPPGVIVTIDGPAGAGKSTAAQSLARRLGFEFLDTGAMYRAVALAAIRAGVALDDSAGLSGLLSRLDLQMAGGQVLLAGEDVSGLIRTQEVSAGSSVVAASAIVRPHLAQLQRQVARGRRMVCEGRDQGTVVFPDALCKFFLFADPEERLRRRERQLGKQGESVDREALRKALLERDQRDSTRAIAPLRPAEDAVLLDSTGMSVEEVAERMEAEVRSRLV